MSCLLLVIMIGPGFFPQEQSDSPEEFVGAEVCGTCHETQFKVWKNSTHGKAGGAPSRDIVIAPFDGTPIRFKDAEVIPSILPDGKYVFTVRQKQRNEKTFPVDGVVGVAGAQGGGVGG
ncbi:MAG: multiheme c-type cytochrome, partial [Bacteroidota bacterium]